MIKEITHIILKEDYTYNLQIYYIPIIEPAGFLIILLVTNNNPHIAQRIGQ